MVISLSGQNGTKIFLPEYEAKLTSALGTAELAVLLKNGKPVLVVSDVFLTEEEIWDKIRPVIDEYPRGQQISEIILLSTPIPRTATGKIQRYRINLH